MAEQYDAKSSPKPLQPVFKWLKIFFLIYIASEVILAIGNSLSLSLGSVMFGPGQPFTIGDMFSMVGGMGLGIAFILSIIWFCRFSFRATRNLHIWEMPDMSTSPGWAVGWYFVPFANLVKPYGVMDEMWTATHALTKELDDISPTLGLWWICWLATNISSNISMRMGFRAGYFNDFATDVPLYKTTLMIDIFSSITGVVAALVILRVLTKITQKQDSYLNTSYFE